jgi:hypothetical protein
MAYRDDLTALGARTDALSTEVASKTRELDEARRLFAEAHARSRLPVLPNIRVATPCTADWAKMTGDDRTRACGACNKNVYNLSGMTRDEAEALIVEKAGQLCVRYFQRADGTILLKDCEVAISQQRRRRVIAVGAAALLAGAGGLIAHDLRATHAPTPVAFTVASVPAQPPELTVTMGGSGFSQPPPSVEVPPIAVVGTPMPPPEELKGQVVYHPKMGAARIIHDPVAPAHHGKK